MPDDNVLYLAVFDACGYANAKDAVDEIVYLCRCFSLKRREGRLKAAYLDAFPSADDVANTNP
nr:hypothetical protein [Roseobacter litoralis]